MDKVIFIDVDATLRNDNQKVTKRTQEAIQKIKSIGYEPIICTGRPRDYAKALNDEAGTSRYIVLSNGAEIFDYQDRKVLYQMPMNYKNVQDLYRIANLDNARFILASNGTRYVNRVKHPDLEVLISGSIDQFVTNNKVIQVTIASPNFEIINNIKDDINDIAEIRIINQSKCLIDSSFAINGTIYYDIVDRNTSKGEAIKHFCEIFNIPKENRIAIGDDSNDVSMFNECGYNVAMKNALPILKELADYETDDNNNDGVAKFLESLIEGSIYG